MSPSPRYCSANRAARGSIRPLAQRIVLVVPRNFSAGTTVAKGRGGSSMRPMAMVILSVLPLAGCAAAGSAVTSLATAGVAGAVGSASGSALLGAVVGFGVSYGVDQGVKYVERRIEQNVQIAIAETAAPLNVGQSATWQVPETLPLSSKSGTVEV